MDESLKARLIGAAVLVALAVLLVPELLSGRKQTEPAAADAAGTRGTRSFTIELEGAGREPTRRSPSSGSPSVAASSAGAPAVADTVATPPPERRAAPPPPAPADAGLGAGAAPAPPSATRAAEPVPAAAAPVPRSGPAAPAPATGGWVVQVGAFGSAETARRLVKDLQGDGYRAFESPVVKSGKTLYRVRVGPEPERAAAEQLASRLKARGLPSTIVRND